MRAVRRGSGKPLLLVHGLGSSARNWDPVVPALSAAREVIAVDLPGFAGEPAVSGPATIAALTDALQQWIVAEGLAGVDVVGSSMGARMVLEMARRGHRGTVVSLDPGGFWTDVQAKVFGGSIKASVALVRTLQPVLPALARSPVGRTALLTQFSARPWALSADLVLTELRGFRRSVSPSLDSALDALANGPRQEGAPTGSLHGKVVIGWGRHDRVTLPSQAARACAAFPDATLHWFEESGHFPHWDSPDETVDMILSSTA